MGTKEEMLSVDEIQNLKISLPIIKEGLAQAEKRLQDFLQNKNDTTNKLFIFFNAYLTITVALISAAFIVKEKYHPLVYFVIPLIPFFLGSLIFFLLGLRSTDYGAVGTLPEFWLRKDTISGDENTLGTVLAYLTHSYQDTILKTYSSNEKKIAFQNAGLYLSIFGIITSAIIFLLYYFHRLNYSWQPFSIYFPAVLVVEMVASYLVARFL